MGSASCGHPRGAVLLLANAIAAIPARTAARTQPAVVLRTGLISGCCLLGDVEVAETPGWDHPPHLVVVSLG